MPRSFFHLGSNMPKRQMVLLGVLALSYMAMISYLAYKHPEQIGFLAPTTSGLVWVGVVGIALRLEGLAWERGNLLRLLKVLVISFGTVVGGWIIASVLVLPVFGVAAMKQFGNPIFLDFLLGISLLVSLVIAKKYA